MTLPNFYTKKQEDNFSKPKDDANLSSPGAAPQKPSKGRDNFMSSKPPEIKPPEIKKAFSPSNLGPNTSSISSVSTKPTAVEEILRRENKKKKILALSLILIFLPVLAFGALYGTDNLYRVVGGLPRDPKKAIVIVNENMAEVKSMHMEGQMDMDFDIPDIKIPEKEALFPIQIKLSGDIASSNKAKISMTTGELMSTDLVMLDNKVYMKIKGEAIGGMNNFFGDTWFEIPMESEEAKNFLSMQEAYKWKSYDKFIKNAQTLDKSNKDTHYRFDLEADKVLKEPEFNKAFQNLSEVGGDLDLSNSTFSIEVWIDNSTKLVNQELIDMSLVFKVKSPISDETKTFTGKVKIKVAYSDFNKEIKIEKPTNVKPFTELMLSGVYGDIARKDFLKNFLADYLKQYNEKTGHYPISQGLEKTNDKNSSVYKELTTKLNLSELPVDPKDPQYFYGYKSDGKSYELSAVLENQDDPECRVEGNLCIYRIRDGEVVSKK